MKRISTIILLLICALILCSCGISQEKFDAAVKAAYQEGHEDGTSEGYDLGYPKGKEAGHKEGYQEGYKAGHDAGYDEGYAEGYDAGLNGRFSEDIKFIANKSSMKFHKPDCGSVNDIKPKNLLVWKRTREELVAEGYDPCGKCNP